MDHDRRTTSRPRDASEARAAPHDPADPPWLASLSHPAAYPHPVQSIERLETHLSWVFLTGEWAYKLKKPLRFPFVDFSTLEKRHAACMEELRLNQRTAPAIYDRILPLVQTNVGPRFGASGPVLEFAVKMRQFTQSDILLNVARTGRLTTPLMDELGRSIAELHRRADVAPAGSSFGTPAIIRQEIAECFPAMEACSLDEESRQQLKDLQSWTVSEHVRLQSYFVARRHDGFVRECHGDLHMGNIVLLDGVPRPFDCLEFNAELRFIDVVSDVAFVTMDLQAHDAPKLAMRLLNSWLEQSGDFGGVCGLHFYQVYRALVRGKVAAIRLSQENPDTDEASRTREQLRLYLALAHQLSQPTRSALALMHGLSGSGKSVTARRIAEEVGGIVIRSDIERKRLFGMWPPSANRPPAQDLYSVAATAKVYDHLLSVTRQLLADGQVAIVDAAFLEEPGRRQFQELARSLGRPWTIVACEAPRSILEERVTKRQAEASDASDATVEVLKRQETIASPLTGDERGQTVIWNTDGSAACTDALAKLQRLIQTR